LTDPEAKPSRRGAAEGNRQVVVLTGFMGVGKSATGRLLARMLRWSFVDLDDEIEAMAGKAVDRIFAEDGEARFRELESRALARVLPRRRVVLATGGGVLLREENRALLAETRVFYLYASPEECLRRVRTSSTRRPLLEVADPEQTARRIYAEREQLYEVLGQRIETEGRNPEEVAQAIAGVLEPGQAGAGNGG